MCFQNSKIYTFARNSRSTSPVFLYNDNTELFYLIDVMVAMIATTDILISIYLFSEHILKLVLGALVYLNNIVTFNSLNNSCKRIIFSTKMLNITVNR